MDKSGDNLENQLAGEVAGTEANTPTEQTRRKFSRNAVLGGAVLLSLGNRAAWSAVDQADPACLSATLLASFVNNTGMMSVRPGAANEQEQMDALVQGPEMLNRCPTLNDPVTVLDPTSADCPNPYMVVEMPSPQGTQVCVVEDPTASINNLIFSNARGQDGVKLGRDIQKSQNAPDGPSSSRGTTPRSTRRGG